MPYKIVCQVVHGVNTYWRYGTMIRVLDLQDQSADLPKGYDLRCVACTRQSAHSLLWHEHNISTDNRADNLPSDYVGMIAENNV